MKKPDSLYYICHIDNLQSILKDGIYCRSKMTDKKHTDIHNAEVLSRRGKQTLANGKIIYLQDYVNLYFQPRNAMLYRLICNGARESFVILSIDASVLDNSNTLVTDRNAAAEQCQFFESQQGLEKIDGEVFKKEYWTDSDETKRKMMAEVLVPEQISPNNIVTIYHVNNIPTNSSVRVIPEKYMFFAPTFMRKISDYITLSRGDMFFSKMQTFTISVNTVGVMGKGLASRAKYQFPDAYVRYQDDCKSKKLQIGKPTLYKRAVRIEEVLADDSSQLKEEKLNGSRWFLFLPTKRHWRDNSRLEDIEESMKWLVANYQKEGIKSIALPALGCGLGGLHWRDVGPLMGKYLKMMPIQSSIYLPTEEQVTNEYLSAEYLLD